MSDELSVDAFSSVSDVSTQGFLTTGVRVPRLRRVGVVMQVYRLNGANGVSGMVQGSDDQSQWRDLVDIGPLGQGESDFGVVSDPPLFLRVRLTLDAPLDFSGSVTVATTLPMERAPSAPKQDELVLAREAFLRDFATRYAPRTYDPVGRLAAFGAF
jgi:hypothetical protein